MIRSTYIAASGNVRQSGLHAGGFLFSTPWPYWGVPQEHAFLINGRTLQIDRKPTPNPSVLQSRVEWVVRESRFCAIQERCYDEKSGGHEMRGGNLTLEQGARSETAC